MAQAAPAPLDPAALLRSKNFVVLLVLAGVLGIVVSFLSWCFLELIHGLQTVLFTKLPSAMGYDSPPEWWLFIVLGVAGVPAAFAIAKLPGAGGHVPAKGLQMGGTTPSIVPGVLLAAFASLGFGLVLGPEAPLIALGAGSAMFFVQRAKKDATLQLLTVIAAAGSFAAISAIFGSPVVAAVLVIEATGLGGPLLSVLLLPGLIAAGLGSLVFVGMASWTGLNTSAYALVPLQMPSFGNPTWAEIGWSIALGLAGAVLVFGVRRLGLAVVPIVSRRLFLLLPVVGVLVAGLAVAFDHATGKGVDEVLFSGQDALPGLVSTGSTWALWALFLLLLFKGLAWGLSLGSFRGGPTFPALFLGAAGGILASHLPGMSFSPGIAVGMGVMVAAMLKLPLSAIILATALTLSAGLGVGPLIIVGVVVSYLVTLVLEAVVTPTPPAPAPSADAGSGAETAEPARTG
jgi:H+/Cl- antiporter ClcA